MDAVFREQRKGREDSKGNQWTRWSQQKALVQACGDSLIQFSMSPDGISK